MPASSLRSSTIRDKKYASLAVAIYCQTLAYQDVLDYLLEMTKLYPARAAGDLLSGLLNMRLGYMLVGVAGIAQSEPAVKIKKHHSLKKLASLLKGWRLDITGTKDFSAAQVTAGGVPLTELDPHTMASKKAPGLYLAGEMLNIHGDCGGYNLHFSWASGITAGKSAAYRCLKEKNDDTHQRHFHAASLYGRSFAPHSHKKPHADAQKLKKLALVR